MDVVALKTNGRSNEGLKADNALEVLRERIANHELLPGSKLRENTLSEELGVSRARIREIFGTLEERGLIQRIPNRGAVVTRLDADQAFELFDVREVLEGLCARLATENTKPESWQDLLEIYQGTIQKHVADGDLETYIEIQALLRQRMIEACNNALLIDHLDSLHDRTRMLIRRIVILPGRAELGCKEQHKMLKAMRAGDAVEAERLKRANIRSARDWLFRYKAFVL